MHSSKDLSALGGDSLIDQAHRRNEISGSSDSCKPMQAQHLAVAATPLSNRTKTPRRPYAVCFQSQMDEVCKYRSFL